MQNVTPWQEPIIIGATSSDEDPVLVALGPLDTPPRRKRDCNGLLKPPPLRRLRAIKPIQLDFDDVDDEPRFTLDQETLDRINIEDDVDDVEVVTVIGKNDLEQCKIEERRLDLDVKMDRLLTNNEKKAVHNVKWCFTMNNPRIPPVHLARDLENHPNITGGVFQLERGENGTEHYQGYLEFNKRMYMTGVKKCFGANSNRVHVTPCSGSRMKNIKYCTKPETYVAGPWWIGDINEETETEKRGNQGARKDLHNGVQLLRERGDDAINEILEIGGDAAIKNFAQMQNMAEKLDLMEKKKSDMEFWKEQRARRDRGEEFQAQKQRDVFVYFGPTAVGKTTEVKMNTLGLEKGLFVKTCDHKWWCGYNGEPTVMLDEFKGDGSFITIEGFNNMTNEGAYQVEIKGGQKTFKATEIHVASNTHPCHWWKARDGNEGGWRDPRYQAVARRCKQVYWWKKATDKEPTILANPGPCPENVSIEELKQWEMQSKEWQHFWKGPGDTNYVNVADGHVRHNSLTGDVRDYFNF